jgi:hypothetical protein
MSDNAAAPAAAPAAPAAPTQESGANGDKQVVSFEATPKKKPPTFHKFKVGEEEVALTQEDIERDYKKWKGADAKARETAEARKSVENFMKALAEDPEKVLNDPKLPIDRKKLAEKWLVKQIESELTPSDPKDKELEALRAKLKEREDKDAEVAKTKEEQEYAQAKEQRKAVIGETLSKAMEATALAKHPESASAVLREMAMYMRAARERGEEVTPDELVQHIHNQRFQQFYTLANQFEGEELIEFLGEEVVKRLRRADLDRLRKSRDPGQQHKSEAAAPGAPAKRRVAMDPFAAKQHANKILLGK